MAPCMVLGCFLISTLFGTQKPLGISVLCYLKDAAIQLLNLLSVKSPKALFIYFYIAVASAIDWDPMALGTVQTLNKNMDCAPESLQSK